jgi:ABC-type multidrug transport system ATPase subunit
MCLSWSKVSLTVPLSKNAMKKQKDLPIAPAAGVELDNEEKFPAENLEILQCISGEVKAGEFLAILGPSGAGKSSLLNVLSLRTRDGASGIIQINGSDPKLFLNNVGYVKQETVFFETLTVRETLTFAADLRMSRKLSHRQKAQRVNDLLEEMDLIKCADSHIGTIGKGISGGERKRLTVAMELINSPELVFCE